jgi:hypothetical protein
MVVVDACIHFKHVHLLRCGFKPGSVKRFIDPYTKEGIPQAADNTLNGRHQ